MEIVGIVIVGLLIVVVIIAIVAKVVNDKNAMFDLGVIFGIILSILTAIELVLINSILETPKPTAMDEYQGKTTLEYTIRDRVKIERIVVFKDSIYGTINCRDCWYSSKKCRHVQQAHSCFSNRRNA